MGPVSYLTEKSLVLHSSPPCSERAMPLEEDHTRHVATVQLHPEDPLAWAARRKGDSSV